MKSPFSNLAETKKKRVFSEVLFRNPSVVEEGEALSHPCDCLKFQLLLCAKSYFFFRLFIARSIHRMVYATGKQEVSVDAMRTTRRREERHEN